MEQLKWFTGLLREYQVSYWIDSGTLLGLMRDGKLLDSDHDIDISIWEKDESSLRQLLEDINTRAYTVESHTFSKVKLHYQLLPLGSSILKKIDIGIFREHNGYAYRHAPIPDNLNIPANLHKRKLLFRLAFRSLRFVLRTFRRFRSKRSIDGRDSKSDSCPNNQIVEVNMSSFSQRFFHNPKGTWWIPSSYFRDTSVLTVAGVGVSIPKDWEDYLRFRYGDWKTPTKEWCYWRDDRAFRQKLPEELMKTAG